MKYKFQYLLIFISAILFIANVWLIDFEQFTYKDLFGPFSNILLILAMIVSIKDSGKSDR